MEKLNVTCKCGKGQLVTLDLIHDDYKMGCDTCPHTFMIHYTGYDEIMEAHEYNSKVCESVKLLNAHGLWSIIETIKIKQGNVSVESLTKGMKHIQTIDNGYEIRYYYQAGANFFVYIYNGVHKQYEVGEYRIEDVNDVPVLMNHFFGAKAKAL